MEKIVRYIAGRVYKPLLTKYLSATRLYSSKGFRLVIPPGVFHPGFFFSTRLLLAYLAKHPLKGRSFLELGAGSGLISLFADREGARVTASDIDPIAVESIKLNRSRNRGEFAVVQSDLFGAISPQTFDIIAINPPYYKKKPLLPGEFAWYCGENGEYFENLFGSLRNYSDEHSTVLMILCDGCDIPMIREMAAENGFRLDCVFKKRNWVETNFIFRIK